MRPFSYVRAVDASTAIALVRERPDSAFLAGGTAEVDLVRQDVLRPGLLVDINDLPLDLIEDLPDGGVRIGALARMSDVARAPGVMERFPVISQALVLGASAQLRNMASMGGNLCQRVRCSYFRDPASPCNKRDPGSGCAALNGFHRGHAILGTSDHCIATHPSDVAVPLTALDAVVHTSGPGGERAIGIDDFFLLPGDTPQREHPLEHGELITAIEVPGAALPVSRNGKTAPRSALKILIFPNGPGVRRRACGRRPGGVRSRPGRGTGLGYRRRGRRRPGQPGRPADRTRVMGCRRSRPLAAGRCCCCHRCCQL